MTAANDSYGDPAAIIDTGSLALGSAARTITVQPGSGGSVAVKLQGGVYTVTFGGTLGRIALQAMTGVGITNGIATIVSPGSATAPAVQQFSATGPFTLTFDGQTTALLPANATAAQVTAALNALATIGGNQYAELVISAPITGTVGLTKMGAGILSIASNNPISQFSGVTTITQGTLLADGPSAPNSVNTVVLNGGTLGGNGEVGHIAVASIANGGTVMPGDGPIPASPPQPNPVPAPITLTINTTLAQPVATLCPAPQTNLFVSLNHVDASPTGNNDGPSTLLSVAGPAGYVGPVLNLNPTNNPLGGVGLTGIIDPAIVIGDSFTIIQTTSPNYTIIGKLADPYGTDPSGPGQGLPVTFINGQKFDVIYTPTSVTLVRALDQTTVTVSSSANPSVWGQPVTFTATVTPEPGVGVPPNTDDVVFTLDGVDYVVFLNNGKATFTPPGNLSVGTHTLSVVFNPPSPPGSYTDPNFATNNGATLTGGQIVNKATTTVTLSSLPPNPIPGQVVTVTATITAVAPGAGIPTGTVTFTVDGGSAGLSTQPSAVVVNGGVATATVTITGLIAGTHRVRATYNGDIDFKPFSTPSDYLINVVRGTPGVSISATPVSSAATPSPVFGQTVTLSATLSGPILPTGTVTFYNGAIAQANILGTGTLSGGVATTTTNVLGVGGHTINIAYSGDPSFFAVTTGTVAGYKTVPGAFPYTVYQAATQTTLTASQSTSGYGQSVRYTAQVVPVAPGAGTPTGTVTYYFGNTTLGSALVVNSGGVIQAVLAINTLPPGIDNVTAKYNGNTNFASSTSLPFAETVQVASKVTVTSSGTPSVYGQAVNFTATVAAQAPATGHPGPISISAISEVGTTVSVTTAVALPFTDGQTVLIAGVSPAGYNGTYTATVTGSNTFTYTAAAGLGAATFTSATVASDAVTFWDGPANTGINLGTFFLDTNGKAIVNSITSLSVSGSPHTITVSFPGDNTYQASSGTTTQVVNKASTTTSASNPAATVFGQATSFSATVAVVSPGFGTPTNTVTFFDGPPANNKSLGNGTLAANVAVLNNVTSLSVGTHTIYAVYNGDGSFAGSQTSFSQVVNQASTTTTLSSSPTTPVFGQTVTLSATVAPVSPGAGAPTGKVTFYNGTTSIGSVTLTAANNGIGTITYAGLPLGPTTITATYAGDTSFLGSSATTSNGGAVTLTVSRANSTTVVSASLNPVGAGTNVTLTATVSAAAPGSGTPTGTVQFKDGSSPIGGPVTLSTVNGVTTATVTTSFSVLGAHTIVATYSGDTNFIGGPSANFTENVLYPSTTTVSSSPNPSFYGEAVLLTATVASSGSGSVGVPTGSVTFYEGTTALATANLTASGSVAVAVSAPLTTLSPARTPSPPPTSPTTPASTGPASRPSRSARSSSRTPPARRSASAPRPPSTGSS